MVTGVLVSCFRSTSHQRRDKAKVHSYLEDNDKKSHIFVLSNKNCTAAQGSLTGK